MNNIPNLLVAPQLTAAKPIRIKRVASGLSIAVAAIVGVLLIFVEPSVGREYIDRIFAIYMLGGLGRMPGTRIAALLPGVVEGIAATFYGASRVPAMMFSLLLPTLAFRPAGLFGR